jgi:hypothetical protein
MCLPLFVWAYGPSLADIVSRQVARLEELEEGER